MFYSETLLSKTGPLARVWLSANLERKLSKSHILQSNIESSVSAIVDQGQAPMALRLSGQLLLGVVRIYSRKARYLLDDCNEALMKIKMAFRPGNVDMPSNQLQAANPASLTMPDVLTELDLLPPMPDASLLLTQPSSSAAQLDLGRGRVGRHDDISLMDDTDQLLSSIDLGLSRPNEKLQLEDELEGLDIDPYDGPTGNDTSLHIGRDAPAARPFADEFSDDLNFGADKDLDLDIDDVPAESNDGKNAFADNVYAGDDDMDFGGGMDFTLDIDGNGPDTAPTPGRLARDSQSPLSSLRSSVERDLNAEAIRKADATFAEPHEEDDETLQHPHRARHRKILQPDADTILHTDQLRQQQRDRSKILKPASFLPRDPVMLALEAMQRNGGFVSSILGDGRGKGWAPELRGILSLELVRKSGELKRKRDSGIADVDVENDDDDDNSATARKQPRLELGSDDDQYQNGDLFLGGDSTEVADASVIDLAANANPRQPVTDDDPAAMGIRFDDDDGDNNVDDYQGISPINEHFDDTTIPAVHPADSGPVSLGTKHAVHLLRERFGPVAGAADGESTQQQKKSSVLFQELLPERNTTKIDATKMFFEVLVLATKDAVKVEQAEGQLGAPIRVRAKRGLWGSWAEQGAGGEIAEQETDKSYPAAAAVAVAV
ncbi:MAG: hypothetical protein M1825_004887 [Sarcosagium campestre]|nr:MAG: hypothetical protein M1825_004887 [Sarcosagium campestre]